MTTLSDAEPGDTAIVAIKLRERAANGAWWASWEIPHVGSHYLVVEPKYVRSIEKAPRPLKVGDPVKTNRNAIKVGRIVAISDVFAWVKWEGNLGRPSTEEIAELYRPPCL